MDIFSVISINMALMELVKLFKGYKFKNL
jgi:hypothetical protein